MQTIFRFYWFIPQTIYIVERKFLWTGIFIERSRSLESIFDKPISYTIEYVRRKILLVYYFLLKLPLAVLAYSFIICEEYVQEREYAL